MASATNPVMNDESRVAISPFPEQTATGKQRMIERRAVDAVIWGMPIVSLDAMRQAYFRDGKAKYGDIIWWPKGNDWKNQSLTPNTSLRYLYIFLNTKDDGPVVLDLPPAGNGSSLLGTIADAWQVCRSLTLASRRARILRLVPRRWPC
jgi:hypothetical protein